MASLITGYNYDIFISYRQKDNKHDGWVTKFVENLKGELEATFKEDVSVYFDENPHNRLQETHNVDKSLEDKLKCLIFIPILSQTYCDPSSYAWQNEFLAFVEMAEDDRFGKDVKLRSGNVASRILPIRIHDLESEDVKLFEKETGSVLRALDFVFKTATGAIRPLLPKEDHPNDNLYKTFYRDQISKVGIAIKEIILSMKKEPVSIVQGKVEKPAEDVYISEGIEQGKTARYTFKSRKLLWLVVSFLLIMVGAIAIYSVLNHRKDTKKLTNLDKSIAVLPFVNDSPDEDNSHLINGLMDEILINLQVIHDLTVISRNSVEQFRGDNKLSTPVIAKKLGVNYIVEGSGQKYGNNLRLRVQLIAVSKGKERHLWGKIYDNEITKPEDYLDIQSDVAESIANELKAIISPEEELLIEKLPTTNLTAYDFFQRGKDEYIKYLLGGNRNNLKNAVSYYKLALRNDSAFAQAYIGLARAHINSYWSNVSVRLSFSENELKTVNDSILSLVNKALTLNKNLDEAYMVRGWCSVDDKQALKEFRKALEINPNNSMAYYNISNIFFYSKEEVLEGIKYMIKAIELEKGPFLPDYLWSLGQWYEGFGFNANALDIYNQTFQLTKDTLQFYRDMSGPYYVEKNWKESIRWAKKILGKDPQNQWAHQQLAAIYTYVGKIDSAAYHLKNLIELDSTSLTGKFNKGALYWLTGNDKEAKLIFNALSKFLQQLIKTRMSSTYDVYSLAIIYSIEGDKNKAFEYLKMVNKSMRTENWCRMDMELNPLFKNIRSDPQFQEMLRESKSNWQEEHDKIYTWLKENNLLKI